MAGQPRAARKTAAKKTTPPRSRPQDASSAERTAEPSVEERKGKRGHDDQGNVRPADGRYGLHDPKDESKYVRTSAGDD